MIQRILIALLLVLGGTSCFLRAALDDLIHGDTKRYVKGYALVNGKKYEDARINPRTTEVSPYSSHDPIYTFVNDAQVYRVASTSVAHFSVMLALPAEGLPVEREYRLYFHQPSLVREWKRGQSYVVKEDNCWVSFWKGPLNFLGRSSDLHEELYKEGVHVPGGVVLTDKDGQRAVTLSGSLTIASFTKEHLREFFQDEKYYQDIYKRSKKIDVDNCLLVKYTLSGMFDDKPISILGVSYVYMGHLSSYYEKYY